MALSRVLSCAVVCAGALAASANAGLAPFTVDYTASAGGNIPGPLNGLAARATFDLNGTTLIVTLKNISTGAPSGFQGADSYLVSLGFDLPAGVNIVTGTSALIASGSTGIGAWAARAAGASVAEEWLWTNDFGGDLMNSGEALARRQIISTSSGQGGGTETRFDGLSGTVDGPSGGMVPNPQFIPTSGNQAGVQDSIVFTVQLSAGITSLQLETMANGGVVEFGSDAHYLTTPTPGAATMLGLALVGTGLRRRR